MVVIVIKLRLNAVNNISLKKMQIIRVSGRKYINCVIKMFGPVPPVGRCAKRLTSTLHTFTHFIFFFLQQNNLDYVDPQIANLLFEAGQSSTNIGYNI